MSEEARSQASTPDTVISVESLELPEGLFDGLSTMSPLARHTDLRTADFRRRDRDKKMVREEQQKIKSYREAHLREKEEEKRRDMEMLASYNPWGRPGGGAPTSGDHNLKQVVAKEFNGVTPLQASQAQEDEYDELRGGILKGLGRPGAGAPLRTQSGRLRVQLSGDPELRFGEKVAQSIQNGIRYKGPGKENYKLELDNMVKQKQEAKERERLLDLKEEDEMGKMYPFGRRSAAKERRNTAGPLFPPLEDTQVYHPWGNGLGNPLRDDRGRVHGQKRPLMTVQNGITNGTNGVLLPPFNGRGGGGAPQRTSTGTLQTRLRHLTPSSEPGRGSNGNLLLPDVEDDSGYNPWGRPGHGAPFGREQGQNFMEKMGWSSSNEDSHQSTAEAKRVYLKELQREMETRRETQKLEKENLFSTNDSGIVDVMLSKEVGRPKKDVNTGRLLPQVKGHSDVTAQRMNIRRVDPQERRAYHSALRRQAQSKHDMAEIQRELERDQLRQHLDTCDGLWGKPGNGAPRENNNNRINLDSVLFANGTQEALGDRTLARYGKGKDYEFHAPWAATIY